MLNESPRCRRARMLGFVPYHSDALSLLTSAGDIAIVDRGTYRSLVMQCPDGCGEAITINLDERTGKAWRVYITSNGVTLFPSVWRDTGCESHFVLWNSRIYWMSDSWEEADAEDPTLEERILNALRQEGRLPYAEIADSVEEIPWLVLKVCRRLRKSGTLRGHGRYDTEFSIKDKGR